MSGNWKRPDTVPFPSVWSRFKGPRTQREYWIQDIPDEYLNQTYELLSTHFLRDESLCKHSSPPFDEKSSQEVVDTVWKPLLAQRLGLICLTKDERGKEVIVGINATYRVGKDDPKAEMKNEKIRKTFGVTDYVTQQRDPFKELKIDAFLRAHGLVVLPEYRGDDIGVELLKAREPLCKAIGIKASLTVFTGIASQKVAEKAGYKDFVKIDYDELEKVDPSYHFPGITKAQKSIRYMYILYE